MLPLRQCLIGAATYRAQCVWMASSSVAARCLSTSYAALGADTGPSRSTPHIPAALLLALEQRPKVGVAKFPDAGRGLVAALPIGYGENLFRELPMVCYNCLSVLLPTSPRVHARRSASDASPRWFCCQDCAAAADKQFYALESLALDSMSKLEQLSKDSGERFPLMVARLAFMHLSAALNPGGSTSAAPQKGEGVYQGDPVAGDVKFLCFANVGPEPYPQPWVDAYSLLLAGMEQACVAVQVAEQARAAVPEAGQEPAGQGFPAGSAARMQNQLASLDLHWFVAMISRLHINVFRVGAVLPMDGWVPLSVDGASGSAAYLVSSLFNHNCEPNVDVVFPRNDGMASFVAARDIDEGEQLCISYIESYSMSLEQRRKHLRHTYGFICRCQLCQEEESDQKSSS
eukprot:gene16228-22394_t